MSASIASIGRVKGHGGVAPVELKGKKILYNVELLQQPPDKWIELFRDQHAPRPNICDPKEVTFTPAGLRFEAEEKHAIACVADIDQWIEQTNGEYATHLSNVQREDQERRDRLQRAADMVKDL